MSDELPFPAAKKKPYHASPEETERRRALVAMHAKAGFTRNAIADALGVGQGVITADMKVLDLKVNNHRKGPIPEHQCRWRDGDEPLSVVVAPKLPRKRRAQHEVVDHLLHIRQFNDESVEKRTAKGFAFRVRDARDAGDIQWLADQAHIIETALLTLSLMNDALHDEAAMKRLQEARDGSPLLRVVNDDT